MPNWKKIRAQFPMTKQNIIYFDSAAASFKHKNVIQSGNDYYKNYGISNRSSDSLIGLKVEEKIRQTREIIADFLNANNDEIIFTSGTTDSINKVSKMLLDVLEDGDEILLSTLNHSSNVLPWIELKKYRKIEVKFSSNLYSDINEKTKIVSYSQESNNFDFEEDLNKIYKHAKEYGALVINDAAQAIAHQKVSFDFCDVIAFSANKLFGPTGVGILAVKKEILDTLKPTHLGGGSVVKINFDGSFVLQNGVEKFESGTLNIAGIIQLKEAFIFIQKVGIENIFNRIKELSNYLYTKLNEIENIEIFNKKGSSLYLFNIKNINAQDIVHYLGTKNIILRSGVFCSYLSTIDKNVKSSARVSLGIYNSFEEIDKLVDELKNGGDFLDWI
ncbi:aminotransferase class V-fold PLP-dependent enzyme [Mycoplasmopsis pulmonis]|uniref:aminotransferase class V-fold PLP-dependent enzyme n=1 Tax=Mycoplasmopsis pulmonis TaxID=2107 RepID=UPI001004DFCB|nr:aminotransferase class V-fold PLP-dependent enzyme [Mycoplasmopsis pulmonis]VEU67937.1 Probable cysteine desulfurase [Mycoplasmopsis pulmonis]